MTTPFVVSFGKFVVSEMGTEIAYLKYRPIYLSDIFDMINAAYHDKPFMFISAMFLEKLVSHHQTVYINC